MSVFELNQLALPDPRVLKETATKGRSMDEAVDLAFGLVSEK